MKIYATITVVTPIEVPDCWENDSMNAVDTANYHFNDKLESDQAAIDELADRARIYYDQQKVSISFSAEEPTDET